jgi:hypothetical protein
LMLAAISKTPPTTIKAMVSAEAPGSKMREPMSAKEVWTLTRRLTRIESNEETDNSSDQQDEPDKIEFGKMFLEGTPFLGIQIEEKEDDSSCNTARGPWEINVSTIA